MMMKSVSSTMHKYSFLCPFCKIVTFLNFEEAAFKNAIIYLKRQQFVTKLRQQIKDEIIRWEEKKKTVKVFEDYLNNSLYSCK